MANNGQIKDYHPPSNTDGTKFGSGTITEDGTNTEYVFHTPTDNNDVSLPPGTQVTFDVQNENARKANNVKKRING